MMLSHLNNIVLQRNILINSNNNNVDNFNLYQLLFNECKKKLLNKEIKFDNISTKQKKKDDENIISANFIVNNLLNIFNLRNIKKNFYIQRNTDLKKKKKKLDEYIILKSNTPLKNKEKFNVENNDKKHKTNNEIFKNLKNIKNKDFLFYNNSNINIAKKPQNNRVCNEVNNLNILKNKKNFIKDSKNFIYFKNNENNISNMFTSNKNMQKNQNSIHEINSFKKINENNFCKSNKKSVSILNFKENAQWKKAISQQVLLSISNKENKAEIRLKPDFLGSISIKIKMKNDQAKLQFISDHIEIKNFLNNCVPFLRDSLIKNGIFLKKVNISSSFNSEKNKNLFISEYKSNISHTIKKFYKDLTQKTVIDMYI